MYLNKELYVNQEIKEKVKKLEKLQLILALSIIVPIVVVGIVCTALLRLKYESDFMMGYAIAILCTVMFGTLLGVLIPVNISVDKLRSRQTEEVKGQPLYDKYSELLNAGRKLYNGNNLITYIEVGLSVVATWILAIIFPYETYAVAGFVFPILISDIVILTRNRKLKQVRNLEDEIARELWQSANGGNTSDTQTENASNAVL